jgi:uncharacterized glyoxalase superfamily protein PhnB
MAVKNVSGVVTLLSVLDMRKSVDWYRDVLGFEVLSTWEPEGTLHWAMLRLGGATLMLNSMFENAEQAASYKPVKEREDVILYFSCADADEAYRDLHAKGCPIKEPVSTFYGMRQLFIADPDGFQLCFQHQVQEAATPG